MSEPTSEASFSALGRIAQRVRRAAEAAQERCELCGEPIPSEHRHLLEVATREAMCVCYPCSILFDREEAAGGKYRLIPDRRLNLAGFQMSDAQWESLRIPVGMAFLAQSTPLGRPTAFYPGPMGPTEAPLDLNAWEELAKANPVLQEMKPDVEALLVNRTRGARQYFLVPMDDCYRLVGLIRLRWKGLSGGEEVWAEIARFFESLQARATTQAT